MPLSKEVKEIISKSRANGSRGLNLVSNQIGDEGAKALADALKQMPSLTSLDLAGNDIEKEGAEALAGCLSGTKITHLDLLKNNIGNEGATALAECLKNTNITHLYLGGNNIGYEGERALKEAVKANCERIKNEVTRFKNNFLDEKDEFKDLKGIDENIKSEFKKLLGKFGKNALASHMKEFWGLNKEECTIVNKLDEIEAPIKVEIFNSNIATGSTQNQTSSTEEAGQGTHAADLLPNEEGLQPYPTQNTDLVGEIVPDLF